MHIREKFNCPEDGRAHLANGKRYTLALKRAKEKYDEVKAQGEELLPWMRNQMLQDDFEKGSPSFEQGFSVCTLHCLMNSLCSRGPGPGFFIIDWKNVCVPGEGF